MNSRVNLLIFAVKDVLDELDVICPHSHFEAATKTTSHYNNDLFCFHFCKYVFYLSFLLYYTHTFVFANRQQQLGGALRLAFCARMMLE